MSTEQCESAPAVTAPQVETNAAPAADVTQQATTPSATTQRVKNPKRVAAGKMVAERTRLAREEQKKAAEAYHAENKAKKAATETPEPAPTTEGESQKSENPNSGWHQHQPMDYYWRHSRFTVRDLLQMGIHQGNGQDRVRQIQKAGAHA